MDPDQASALCLIVAGVAGFLGGGDFILQSIKDWRLRRRLRRLPAPDDPRLRNAVSMRDWKNRRNSIARFVEI